MDTKNISNKNNILILYDYTGCLAGTFSGTLENHISKPMNMEYIFRELSTCGYNIEM